MNTKKISFFKQYFLYKFRCFRGFTVAAAVMNILSAALPGILLFAIFIIEREIMADRLSADLGTVMIFIGEGLIIAAVWAIAAMPVILAIIPAVSFKFYNNRASMDTIGCLPITYRERFLGDFLGGLCPHMVSFIPSAVIGLIFTAVGQGGPLREIQKMLMEESAANHYLLAPIKDNFVGVYLSVMLMVFWGYLAVYITASFVTSCCGKVGSSILYSFIALILPMGITAIFGANILNSAVGVDAEMEIMKAIMVFPPIGTWISYITQIFNPYYSTSSLFFMFNNPLVPIISLAIIVAFLAGAYFLGKNRKAERVDRDFVYSPVYHVIACALAVSAIGFYAAMKRFYNVGDYIICFVVAFVLYAVMELVHTRSIKKIWQTALKFIGMYAVCIGFLIVAENTGGFGLSKQLPPRSNIAEVSVSGSYFYSSWEDGEQKYITYNSDEAVSAILEEHKKIIDYPNAIYTGGMLQFTYKLKTGFEFTRSYALPYAEAENNKDNILKQASDRIKEFEPVDLSALGFIADPVYDEIDIRVDIFGSDGSRFVIPSKADEFMELLRGDIINHYRDGKQNGSVYIVYTLNGVRLETDYALSDGYERVAEFLSDPENTTEQSSNAADDEQSFRYAISYHAWLSGKPTGALESLNLSFNANDPSEAVKEFIGYIEEYDNERFDEYSQNFSIYIENSLVTPLRISKENEEAALRALMRYIRENISAE